MGGYLPGARIDTLHAVSLLSNESVSIPASSFAEGVEFEETFPESPGAPAALASAAAAIPSAVPSAPAAVPSAPPRLTVVRAEPDPEAEVDVAPAAPAAPVTRHEPASMTDAAEALYQQQLERRLHEAEELVTQTIERMRLDEEQRLIEWVRERREEEERRIAAWVDERRTALERTLEQRATTEDGLARRIEEMLVEWQGRFENRLDQRRLDDERLAERRRISDEERLRAWRAELEQALADRFSQRRFIDRAPLPDRNGEVRSSLRDAIAGAPTARDVGRLLRDVLAEVTKTAAFAIALHHTERDEVAYRYRVAADDELGALLRRETLDDGPDSAAAHMDGWVRAHRAIRVGARNTTVHTAQLAVRDGEATSGVLTLQTEGEAIADSVLARVTELVALAAPRLGQLRASGSFRGA